MEFHNKRDQEIKDALTIAAERTNRWMLLIAILSLIAVSVGVYIGVREYQRKLSAMRPDTVVQFQQKSQADDYGS
jgi:predicted lysophospholipase L1 biosynthesis ABC-type transport system permease subunit